jgi:glycosyltransferase involved in cell wall biosynthesis
MGQEQHPSLCPLLVFADDWGRHPSSCQHLARYLLRQHEIYWVNTIGMRPPKLDLSTLSRGLEKVRNWTHAGHDPCDLPARLHVLEPRMWPTFRAAFGRPLNRELLFRQLTPLVKLLPQAPIAITTVPIVADLVDLLPVKRWVYYCVDDFAEWPGLDQANLRQMEECLSYRADVLIAVSESLRSRFERMGRKAHLITHGVDLDFWRPGRARLALPQLQGLERPLIVFWGVLDRRMDVSWVKRLAADLEHGTIVLVGPDGAPDPELWQTPRVVRVPPLAYEQLPCLAREAAVLIMPYADLSVTRAMQPLKLKEYLATGRPTVVRNLPATRAWAECLDLTDTAESFSRAVRLRLQTGLPAGQEAARAGLAGENWAEKARAFEYCIGT